MGNCVKSLGEVRVDSVYRSPSISQAGDFVVEDDQVCQARFVLGELWPRLSFSWDWGAFCLPQKIALFPLSVWLGMLRVALHPEHRFSAPVRIKIHVCSQWTLSLPFVAEQEKGTSSIKALEGIGWDVEELLHVLSVMSTIALLSLGPERERSSLQPWPHWLHSITFPWSWYVTLLTSAKWFLARLEGLQFDSFLQWKTNSVSVRLKRGKMNSSFPVDWKQISW